MSKPRRPLPRLPWDVLCNIFEQAGPSALAALGGVSFDFLEAIIPFLYRREVVITSYQSLMALFCERTRSEMRASSRINSLLSLSFIEILTLNLVSAPSLPTFFTGLSTSGMINQLPIPLQTLNLRLPYDGPIRPSLPFRHLSELFPRLNPSRVNSTMLNRDSGSPSWYAYGPSHFLPAASWTRTTVLEMKGIIPYAALVGTTPGAMTSLDIFSLPAPPLPRVRLLRLFVKSLCYNDHPTIAAFISWLELTSMNGGPLYLNLMQAGSVELVVESEEERDDAEGAVALFGSASTRSKFKVILE